MRIVSLLMIVVMLFFSFPSFADFDGAIKGYWAEDLIEKEFVEKYFPHLAKDDFKNFDPRIEIKRREFFIALNALMKEYNINEVDYLDSSKVFTRKDMAIFVGKALPENGKTKTYKSKNLPFNDIDDLTLEEKKILISMYEGGILKGTSKDKFSPNRAVSQGEGIITLMRVKGELDSMYMIPFNVLEKGQSFDKDREGLTVEEQDDKVLVRITKMFPTPGYSLNVDKVMKEKNGFAIFLDINSPEEGAILPQVITYKSAVIELKKDDLGDRPYDFVVEDRFNIFFKKGIEFK